jgi:hypothetical protein
MAMAGAPPRELEAPARFKALNLIESVCRDEDAPLVWRLAGADEEELRDLLIAAVRLGALLARGAAAGRKTKPVAVCQWLRQRI